MTAITDAELERLRTHRDNLTNALYLELCFNHTWLTQGNEDIDRRFKEDGSHVCDGFVVDWCRKFALEGDQKPRVLDFGSGIASSLLYLEREGLAHLTTVDALGSEFTELRAQVGVEVPVPTHPGVGEFVDLQLEGPFDLVYVRNALDHNQCPALTWLNLFELVETGGVLYQSHAIREASQENWEQLHQFDLYPVGESLWIEDRAREAFSLVDDLPLELLWSNVVEDAVKPWFTSCYRKLSDEIVSIVPYANALSQLRRAYERRSRWSFQLENMIFRESALRHPSTRPVPIDVDPNRA